MKRVCSVERPDLQGEQLDRILVKRDIYIYIVLNWRVMAAERRSQAILHPVYYR